MKQKELLAESMNNDEQMKVVERAFKRTQRELAPYQSATSQLTDVSFNHALGRPQFGVPLALNTTILAGAFQHSQQVVGPPITHCTQRPGERLATRGSLGKLFKSNKHCWRCGFQKKIHVRSGTAFGDKCANNCGHEQCSKCNERVLDCHAVGFVGPHCPNEPVPNTQDAVADWWKDEV